MAVVIVDRRCLVTHISPSFTELLGWSPDLICGCSLTDLAHPDDDHVGWEAALSALDLLGFATLDCRVRHRSGDWLRMASTMTSHQGSIVLLCEILHRK